jgi:hypothetical protein
MAHAADGQPAVPTIELSEQRNGRAEAPIELAVQHTEAALGQLTKVVMHHIRHGGDTSAHAEAAERDLRSALRQLALIQRAPLP